MADEPNPVFVEEGELAGPHGPLRVRCYRLPEPGRIWSGLVWMHGGGFAFGDLEMAEADWFARRMASAGVAVVSVDYQLAPWRALGALRSVEPPEKEGSAHYPVASEEVGFAYEWANSSTEMGVPSGGWSIGGASAGANLAAGAAMRLRDRGGPIPRSLVLAYAVLHALPQPLAAELAAKVGRLEPQSVLTDELWRAMSVNYVGGAELLSDRYAFPGGHDLSGMPPTMILNSDADTARGSGQRFAAELAEAGVDAWQVLEPGTVHGHLSRADSAPALRSVSRVCQWLTLL